MLARQMAWAIVFVLGACASVPEDADLGSLRLALASRPKVMWVGAHPDDESMLAGVLLAKACAVGGADCEVVSLEAGIRGRCKQASIDEGSCPCPRRAEECPELLGATRTAELRACAAVYRASSLVLGRDNMIDKGHVDETVQLLQSLWASQGTQVVATHGTRGGYGHPAHVWVGGVVVRAWRELPVDARPSLYLGLDLTDRTVDDDVVTDTLWGTAPIDPALGLGVATEWDLVLRALEQHRTQTALDHMRDLGRDRWRSSFHRVEQ